MTDVSNYIPSTYTIEDRQAIIDAYGSDTALIEQAIANHDETHASVEDLLSYLIEQTGDIPDFALMDAELLADPEVIATVQQWRQNLALDPATYSQLISELEQFLNNANVDSDLVNEVADFVEDYYSSHGALDSEAISTGTESGGSAISSDALPVVMSRLMMMLGNPAVAILFYIMGSHTILKPEEGKNTVTYQDVNGNTVTQTVPAGQSLHTESSGFAKMIYDAEETVLDEMQDVADEIDDLTDQLGTFTGDQEDAFEAQEVQQRITTARNAQQVYTQTLEILDSSLRDMIELVSRLSEAKQRTDDTVIQGLA